eukprot:GILK01007632.1.p1 GENE.GILK01007632.1~~GILK01007632.1.p1  ORF type:complete len:494 (-),score=54.47 GILK01007632.1:202-1683(-)
MWTYLSGWPVQFANLPAVPTPIIAAPGGVAECAPASFRTPNRSQITLNPTNETPAILASTPVRSAFKPVPKSSSKPSTLTALSPDSVVPDNPLISVSLFSTPPFAASPHSQPKTRFAPKTTSLRRAILGEYTIDTNQDAAEYTSVENSLSDSAKPATTEGNDRTTNKRPRRDSITDENVVTGLAELPHTPAAIKKTKPRNNYSGRKRWGPDEDEKLKEAVAKYKGKNWKQIAEQVEGRTGTQCLHRWQKVLNPEIQKGPWTSEEDQKLLEVVTLYGAESNRWSQIAASIPRRNGKQCRERWYNHLNPNINKAAWTEEENQIIISAVKQFGHRWAEIAKLLKGRPENGIKNYWYGTLRRRAVNSGETLPAEEDDMSPKGTPTLPSPKGRKSPVESLKASYKSPTSTTSSSFTSPASVASTAATSSPSQPSQFSPSTPISIIRTKTFRPDSELPLKKRRKIHLFSLPQSNSTGTPATDVLAVPSFPQSSVTTMTP